MSDDQNSGGVPSGRRGFLKRLGWVAGGTVAAGVAAVPLSKPDEVIGAAYPEVKSNHVTLPSHGTRVVILGGGLAGLQAGVELTARGFQVTILEKTGSPGGKLKSWRDRSFGPADDPYKQDPSFPGYVREHGIHAVWGFYNNLREFLGRYGWGLMERPDDISIYHFRDRDGTTSHIPHSTWVAPYDKAQFVRNLLDLSHLDKADRADAVKLFAKLGTFDYADTRQREYLDSMTFETYASRMGVSKSLIDKICDSLLEMAYFDNVDKASALTLANITQLVIGSPDDIKVNLYATPVAESFLRPMVNYILGHGGQIHFNTEVSEIEVDQGRVKAIKAAPVAREAIKRCSICGGLIIDGMEIGGECPYCGAQAEMLRDIDASQRAERRFEADYFISALDGPGLKQVVGSNLQALGNGDYFKKITQLHAKSVYVCNLWFEGKGHWEKAVQDEQGRPAICFFATGFKHLGITINRSVRIRGGDGTSMVWSEEYADRPVTVIETQIAKAEDVASLSSKEIAQRCWGELKTVMPDLPQPTGWYVNRWHSYTAYRVGDERNRPPVQSPIENLLFIGDNAFVPHPAVFMEKTNVTAKWATNLLLDKIGKPEAKITILASGTPSLSTTALRTAQSVFL